jgi:hypothetical protein
MYVQSMYMYMKCITSLILDLAQHTIPPITVSFTVCSWAANKKNITQNSWRIRIRIGIIWLILG